MKRKNALIILKMFCELIGPGYSPDKEIKEYVNPAFSKKEVALLEPLHEEMLDELEEDAYIIGLRLVGDISSKDLK